MRMAPTKRFKAKTAAKPNSNEALCNHPWQFPKPQHLKNQKLSEEGTPENRPPPLEDAQIHAGIPWPKAGKLSGNLFETRKRLADPS